VLECPASSYLHLTTVFSHDREIRGGTHFAGRTLKWLTKRPLLGRARIR